MQFPGIHAPAPAELEIESVPYDMPMCYQESSVSKDARASRDSRQSRASSPSTLSDAEKNKLLQEVEAQQADFGIQK